jgi:hypothetical protein
MQIAPTATGAIYKDGRQIGFVENVIASRTSQMQAQVNNSTNPGGLQAAECYSKVRTSGGEQEGRGGAARYLTQLQNMLSTARRNNWALVVFALSSLIERRGGVA